MASIWENTVSAGGTYQVRYEIWYTYIRKPNSKMTLCWFLLLYLYKFFKFWTNLIFWEVRSHILGRIDFSLSPPLKIVFIEGIWQKAFVDTRKKHFYLIPKIYLKSCRVSIFNNFDHIDTKLLNISKVHRCK